MVRTTRTPARRTTSAANPRAIRFMMTGAVAEETAG
jgi:hypothetical protein